MKLINIFKLNKNKKSFEKQVYFIYKDLYRFIYSVVKHPDLTEGLLQETLIKSYEQFYKVKDVEKFKEGIFTIAKNESLMWIKKYRRDVPGEAVSIELLEGFSEGAATTISNEEIDIYNDSEMPDFNIIMDKFYNTLKKQKSKFSLGKKLTITAFFTVAILISMLLSSMPRVVAFKFNVRKNIELLKGEIQYRKLSISNNLVSNPENNTEDMLNEINNINLTHRQADQIDKLVSLEEAKEKVPYKLLIPEYLPDGYKFKMAKTTETLGNSFRVHHTYTNSNKEEIRINQENILPNTYESINFSAKFRKENLNINGLDIMYITDDKNFKKLLWINNDMKFDMILPYNIKDSQIKKIIKSLK